MLRTRIQACSRCGRNSSLCANTYRLRTSRKPMTCSLGLSRSRFEASNARVLGPTRSKLRKFFRMKNSSENFEAIDNARTWSGEVSASVNGIDLAAPRRGKRIETGKTLEQLVIAPCKIDIVAAESEHDDLRTSVQHLLPLDLYRWLMFTASRIIPAADFNELRSPMTRTKRWIDPFHQETARTICNTTCPVPHHFYTVQ